MEPVWAYVSKAAFIVGLLCGAAFGSYANVFPTGAGNLDLTIHNVAAPTYGLHAGLLRWTPAFLLAVGYSGFIYGHSAGRSARAKRPSFRAGSAADYSRPVAR
jgi:hypothetical protein